MRNPFDDLVPPTRWPELTLGEYLVIALVAILLGLFAAESWADQGTTIDCRELAMTIGSTQWAREMGAKRDLVVHDVRKRNADRGMPLANAMAREVRRAWLEGLSIDESIQRAYDRCNERLGDLGLEG